MPTWGRGLAVVASLSLAVLASPVLAAPDDEIEMEPETGSGSAKPPDPPKPDGEIDMPGDPPPGDPPPVVKDPKLAKKVATTAQQAATKGDQLTRQKKLDDAKVQYETAVTAYLKAIELGDDLNLYYDLGVVEDKLGKTAEAARHWRTVIKGTGARADVVKKATAKFDEASTKIGLVTLVVKPEGAAISLDGKEIGTAPLAEPLILMPGTYSFQLAADGFQL